MTAKGGWFIIPADVPADVTVAFTEEQEMFRDTMRKFMAREVAPLSDRLEHGEHELNRDLLRKAGELGLLGIEVPEAYGGLDLDKVTSAIVAAESGDDGAFAATVLDDTGIGTGPIRYFGSDFLKKKYLPGLADGSIIGVYCLTEAGSGSDANAAKTTAVLSDDGSVYTLNGEKTFVTCLRIADIMTVLAQVPGKGLTAFVVERNFPGITISKEEVKMGIKGSPTASVSFTDTPVPVANRLGDEGKGAKIAYNILNLGRFKLAAACLGASRAALAEAESYASVRTQFGLPIRKFGLVRGRMLARMHAYTEAMEAVVFRTAAMLDDAIGGVQDKNDTAAVLKAIESCAVECSIAKVFCSEAADLIVVDNDVQVHGGYGFVAPYKPERRKRDGRVNRIFEGTNEINRLLVVKMLLQMVMKGLVPLMQEGAKIQEELTGATRETVLLETPVAELMHQLNGARKATIMTAGVAFQKLGMDGMMAPDNQEVIGYLADALIAVYAMDCTLGAFAKSGTKEAETRLLFAELVPETEQNIKRALAAIVEGDELRTYLGGLKRLLKYPPVNIPALNRAIVAA